MIAPKIDPKSATDSPAKAQPSRTTPSRTRKQANTRPAACSCYGDYELGGTGGSGGGSDD